jgi:hypothetical protein
MILDVTTFTLIHVVLSLVGIFAGLVVVGGGLIAGKQLDGWTAVFLVTTVLTSVTGFGFAFVTLLPSRPDRAAVPAVSGPDRRRTDSEGAPFVVTQLLVLVLFVRLGRAVLKGFRGGPSAIAGGA